MKDLSETFDPDLDEFPFRGRLSLDYLLKGRSILKEGDRTNGIIEDDIKDFAKCDFPRLDMKFTIAEQPRVEFYYYLFRNLAVRYIRSIYSEIVSGEKKAKESVNYILSNTEEQIQEAWRRVQNINFNHKYFKDSYTPEKYLDNYYRTLGIILIWTHFEVKEIFELECNADLNTISVEEFFEKYPFEIISKDRLEEGKTNLNERIVRKFISYGNYTQEKAVELINKSRELYASLKVEPQSIIEISKLKKRLALQVVALENLIFIQKTGNTNRPERIDFDQLTSHDSVNKIYEEGQHHLSELIEREQTIVGRLEVIHDEFKKLRFLNDPIDIGDFHEESIPKRLIGYLEIRKRYPEQNRRNNLAVEVAQIPKDGRPILERNSKLIEGHKKIASDHLSFFRGLFVTKMKIMTQVDFERMIKYTFTLIETDKLPDPIERIKQIGLPNEWIRYTYYLIHRDIYTTKQIRIVWIDFLHAVFNQFDNTDPKTTKTKFSTRPSNYDHDIKLLGR